MTLSSGKKLRLEVRSFNFLFDIKRVQQITKVVLYDDNNRESERFEIEVLLRTFIMQGMESL